MNIKDGFTKPLKLKLFWKFIKIYGLVNIRERIKKVIEKIIIKDLFKVI